MAPPSVPLPHGPAGSGDAGSPAHPPGDPSNPRVRPDVIFRQLSDDWVIFDPVSNQIHVLNLSAALVWASCDGTRGLDDIVRGVAASYDGTTEDAVRSDVEAALDRFGLEGLLA